MYKFIQIAEEADSSFLDFLRDFESLQGELWGNPLYDWVITVAIIGVSIIVAKALYFVFNRVVKGLTKKSKTKLDDILVDMIEEPIVALVVIAGSWYGLWRLSFSEGVDNFISHSFYAAMTLAVTWLVVRLIDSLIREYIVPLTEKTESDFDDQILPIVQKVLKSGLWVLGIIVALNNAGFDIGALLAGLGIGGLALAMAAKDTVSNFFGGLMIFTDKPFKINDRIQVAGFDGTVTEIGIRSTRLKTLAGRMVTIPNSKFTDGIVENISSEPTRKVVLNLGLTYDTDGSAIEKAMEALKEINAANKNTTDTALISFNNFGDFSLGILFIYYIDTASGADILGTMTEMNLAILNKFNQEGWEFAFPTQTIHSIQQNS